MDKKAMSMAFKNAFAGEHGKVVLDDLDRACYWKIPDMCYVPASDRDTCFNLGKLSVIRYIHKMIDKEITTEENKAVHKEI